MERLFNKETVKFYHVGRDGEIKGLVDPKVKISYNDKYVLFTDPMTGEGFEVDLETPNTMFTIEKTSKLYSINPNINSDVVNVCNLENLVVKFNNPNLKSENVSMYKWKHKPVSELTQEENDMIDEKIKVIVDRKLEGEKQMKFEYDWVKSFSPKWNNKMEGYLNRTSGKHRSVESIWIHFFQPTCPFQIAMGNYLPDKHKGEIVEKLTISRNYYLDDVNRRRQTQSK